MTIKEQIGKLPMWKAAIALFLVVIFLLAGIEEIVISRVFSFMDKTIASFEKEKKQEQSEWEKDEKARAEFDRKWQQGFDDLRKKDEEIFKQARIQRLCGEYLYWLKAHEYMRTHPRDLSDPIIRLRAKDEAERLKVEGKSQGMIDMEKAIKHKEFDPSKCKEEVS